MRRPPICDAIQHLGPHRRCDGDAVERRSIVGLCPSASEWATTRSTRASSSSISQQQQQQHRRSHCAAAGLRLGALRCGGQRGAVSVARRHRPRRSVCFAPGGSGPAVASSHARTPIKRPDFFFLPISPFAFPCISCLGQSGGARGTSRSVCALGCGLHSFDGLDATGPRRPSTDSEGRRKPPVPRRRRSQQQQGGPEGRRRRVAADAADDGPQRAPLSPPPTSGGDGATRALGSRCRYGRDFIVRQLTCQREKAAGRIVHGDI